MTGILEGERAMQTSDPMLDSKVPDTPIDELIDSQADANFWDPSTQLRVVKKKGKVPAYPSEAGPGREAEEPAPDAAPAGWGD